MIRALALILSFLPGPAAAQELTPQKTPDDGIAQTKPAVRLAEGSGATLRALDKVSGTTSNIEMAVGQSARYGSIKISLRECRYPENDPSSDAFAYLTITEANKGKPDFAGWMIASSPALSALDHPRYDVWAIRCKSN